MKRLHKNITLAGALVLIAALGTTAVYAALSITTPTSLTYSAQTATTMQSFTPAMCAAMDTYTTQVLNDTRNNQAYRVRKFPDGKCWMIDNLKLSGVTLTSTDSNVSANFTIPVNPVQNAATRFTNGVCHSSNSAGITGTGTYTSLTCDGTTSGTTGTPANTNFNFIAFSDPSGTENSYNDNCTHGNGVSMDSLTGCGYLYNWYTATAGTGTYATSSGNVTSSICPYGWTLPTGGSSGQFAILNNAMATGSTAASTASSATTRPNWRHNGPWESSLSGNYNSGFGSTGSDGSYWSSTASSATSGYSLLFGYSILYPGTGSNGKSNGYAVRCLL